MSLKYSILVLGFGTVGKSALTVRFVRGEFIEKYDPTIEDAYTTYKEIDGKAVIMDIMDTAGQEEYSALRDLYIKNSEAFVLVYSIASSKSWDHLPKLISKMREMRQYTPPFVLVGNKADLIEEREVRKEDVEKFIVENGIKNHLEVSAKTGQNVTEIFSVLIRATNEWRELNPQKKTKKGGCSLI